MGRRDNVVWKNVCPYCHSKVVFTVYEDGLCNFTCGCSVGDLYLDINDAHIDYLQTRETNHITNFDYYFSGLTLTEFDDNMDDYCMGFSNSTNFSDEELCTHCPFGIAAHAIDKEGYNCWKLVEFLQKKRDNHGGSY